MDREEMSLESLADKDIINVDYSDDDIVIVDNIKKLAEVSPTRIKMNLVVVVKKGKAQIVIGDRTITVVEKQLLLCPPNTVFSDLMSSPDFEFKALFFTNRILQSFLREKMNIWNETMYIYKQHVITLQRQRDLDYMTSLFNLLRIEIEAPTDEYIYRTECIQAVLGSGVLGLCGLLKSMNPDRDKLKSRQGENIFQRFLDLVNSNRTKSRTVEDYASELCISPKYLSVVCKKASGKTANEWIREHMLEEIRYYLKQTDMPIKQIADYLGFANPSFFGKYVKEHLGMTPVHFRMS